MSPPFRVIPPTGRNEGAAGLPVDATGSPPGETRISLRDLTKVFRLREGDFVAVDGFSLDIRDGEFLSIVGPSGCGKSTVLRILAGLERHTSGRVEIEVSDSGAPQLNMVFQEASALPWMTVADNVAYGLRRRRVPAGEVEEKVSYWLNAMALTRFRNAYPHQLSGGMKQRVSIARAFANDPDILLMDEPFAALDAQTREQLQTELLRVWRTTGKTIVFITHGIDEAVVLGQRVAVMTARPGRIKQVITIPEALRSDSEDVRALPLFGEVRHEVWTLLREEVLKTQAAQSGPVHGVAASGASRQEAAHV